MPGRRGRKRGFTHSDFLYPHRLRGGWRAERAGWVHRHGRAVEGAPPSPSPKMGREKKIGYTCVNGQPRLEDPRETAAEKGHPGSRAPKPSARPHIIRDATLSRREYTTPI